LNLRYLKYIIIQSIKIGERIMKEKALMEKKIHVSLPSSVHQRLRVKCALEDTTIQDYVEKLIAEETQDVTIPKLEESKK